MASFGEQLLWAFYIVDRNKTTFQHEKNIPNYLHQIVPVFITFIALEYVVHYLQNGKITRINDGLTSIGHVIIVEIVKLFTAGFEVWGYSWLYEKRFIDLDWQSPWTWWATAIGVDFGYYCVHRASHEISFIWATHQVHHSTEEYNVFTFFRQFAFHHIFSIGFYHPLALFGVPLPAVLVHLQFSLIYQFWIHSGVISNIRPLEWVFNTPSHHGVHHGINKWCLDKNYAGFLIIWDKMFGTFEPERKDEKIVYGLVSQPQTFEPFTLQEFLTEAVLIRAMSMPTWSDKFKALFFGPGWNPGTPRLGDKNALPEKTLPREKYNPEVPLWIHIYLLSHFAIVIVVQQLIMTHYTTFNLFTALTFIGFVFFSLFTVGSTFDNKWWASLLETLRCALTLAILRQNTFTRYPPLNTAIFVYFVVSTFIWSIQSMTLLGSVKKKVA